MNNSTRFGLNNRGTKACQFCGKLSWASRQDETANRAMCQGCFDAAGYENQHSDTNGEHYGNIETLCPICFPDREARRLAKAAATVAGYQQAAAKRAEKAVAREQAAAAKQADKKICRGTFLDRPCDQRASKTSDFCSTCRPYHPHTAINMAKTDAEFLTRQGKDAKSLCGLCGNPKAHSLHN